MGVPRISALFLGDQSNHPRSFPLRSLDRTLVPTDNLTVVFETADLPGAAWMRAKMDRVKLRGGGLSISPPRGLCELLRGFPLRSSPILGLRHWSMRPSPIDHLVNGHGSAPPSGRPPPLPPPSAAVACPPLCSTRADLTVYSPCHHVPLFDHNTHPVCCFGPWFWPLGLFYKNLPSVSLHASQKQAHSDSPLSRLP